MPLSGRQRAVVYSIAETAFFLWLLSLRGGSSTTIPPGGGARGHLRSLAGTGPIELGAAIRFSDIMCQTANAQGLGCGELVCDVTWVGTNVANVTVAVTDDSGGPLEGWTVFFDGSSSADIDVSPPSATTDASGTVTFTISLNGLPNLPQPGFAASDQGIPACACSGGPDGSQTTQTIEVSIGTFTLRLAHGGPREYLVYPVRVRESVTCTVDLPLCDGHQCENCPCSTTGCASCAGAGLA